LDWLLFLLFELNSIKRMNILFFKKYVGIATFALLSVSCSAQNQTSPQAVVEAVPAAYEAENKGWLVNIDEAYAKSQQTGRPILANFTGSDWCGWCKKLTADVFIQEGFKSWADQNVVLLELDYPRRKTLPSHIQAQNSNLQQAFQVQGYPTIWVFNLKKDEGANQFTVDAIGKTGYTKSVEEFTASINQMILQKKTN
jgi:thiol:disulfide interchange protein